jgi:hypothetical protein
VVFRPGERLQHNWASMWLMSQEQGLFPERSDETREDMHKGASSLQVKRDPRTHDSRTSQPRSTEPRNFSSSAILGPPSINEPPREAVAPDSTEALDGAVTNRTSKDRTSNHGTNGDRTDRDRMNIDRTNNGRADQPVNGKSALGKFVLDKAAPASAWSPEEEETKDESASYFQHEGLLAEDARQGFAGEDSDLAVQTFHLSAGNHPSLSDSSPSDAVPADTSSADGTHGASLLQHLIDLHVKLRFHRADLYLGTAVFVAAVALLWPVAGSTQQATLSPWQRALVTLGIAEAPQPQVHLQGDPAIEVWVDPHTALYDCPGEDQYGKTPDGRFNSQREAQMDSFEPASRSACE